MTGEHPTTTSPATSACRAARSQSPGAPRSRADRFVRSVGGGTATGAVVGVTVGMMIQPLYGLVYGGYFGTFAGFMLGVVGAVALALLPCTTAARPVVRAVGAVVSCVAAALIARTAFTTEIFEPYVAGLPEQGTVVAFALVAGGAGFCVADAAGYRLTPAQAAGWGLAARALLAALAALGAVWFLLILAGSALEATAPRVVGLVVGITWAVVGAARRQTPAAEAADGPAVGRR